MATLVTFNQIQIGRKFKTSANITYQKINAKQAKPILDSKQTKIANGRVSTAFYNTKHKLTIV